MTIRFKNLSPSNPLIIGLTGPIGSGKTTIAQSLAANLCDEEPTIIYALAKPMRDMLEAAGVPGMALCGTQDDKERKLPVLMGKSARHAMQTLGTEWGRECIGSDFWLNLWDARTLPYSIRICDDIRFDNESDWFQARGGIVVRLCGRRGSNSGDAHSSESGVKNVSFEVDNVGEPSDVAGRIANVVSQIWRDRETANLHCAT